MKLLHVLLPSKPRCADRTRRLCASHTQPLARRDTSRGFIHEAATSFTSGPRLGYSKEWKRNVEYRTARLCYRAEPDTRKKKPVTGSWPALLWRYHNWRPAVAATARSGTFAFGGPFGRRNDLIGRRHNERATLGFERRIGFNLYQSVWRS